MKNLPSSLKLLAAAVIGLSGATASPGASVPEPDTVFYGRIVNRLSAQPYVLSEGTLTWRIRRPDGSLLMLTTQLQPLKNGAYSYRLNVPHQALSVGLPVTASAVPLSAQSTVCLHDQISVNGFPASIMAPGASAFAISQAARASAYRLDLEVRNPLADLDQDGIPDWWATRYLINSPTGDPDGDGRNNLSEYLNGSDPNHDDRSPTLATTELRAYAGGTTAVLLHSIDSDSTPQNLTYTLLSVPESTRLLLRNTSVGNANHDSALTSGATFTQADIDAGRLVLTHQGDSISPGSLQVTLRDENAEHPAVSGTVSVTFYRPASAPPAAAVSATQTLTPPRFPTLAGLTVDEEPMAVAYCLSKELSFVVFDAADDAMGRTLAAPSAGLNAASYGAQYVTSYGMDRRHLFLGSAGGDHISGSMEGDVLIGGRSRDWLRGNGGADLFVLCSTSDGDDIVEDFNASEGDVLDLSRLLSGASPWVTNYIQPVVAGTDTLLRLSFAGSGGSYSDMTVTLSGVQLNQSAFLGLVESGQIYAGDKVPAPRVTVAASQPNASENGPLAGEVTLTRTGPLNTALTVNLLLTGSALNGVDYSYISPQVTFLPGNRSLTVQVSPFIDALTELNEVVDLAVLPGNGYELGGTTTGRVTIEDLAPQLSITVLEPIAVKSELTPGVLLVSRAGVTDRSVLVRLNVSGTATATDYEGVPSFINFQAGQATALLFITPRSTAAVSGGAKFVQVSIRSDPTYLVLSPSQARVTLVEEMMSFPRWRERYFPTVPGELSTFAVGDIGLTGIRHFQRYAFGLSPTTPETSPGRPLFQLLDGHLTVQFRRPLSQSDVQYVVEVSEDLVTWQAGGSYVKPVVTPESVNQPETAVYRVEQSVSDSRTMFMRVRPVYAP